MEFYKRFINLNVCLLFVLTLLSFIVLSSPLVLAKNTANKNLQVNVPISCNLSSSTDTSHTATVDAGTYRSEIGESTITATCNDSEGFAIYAIGYTGEDYGDNTLKHTTDNTLSIASGTATSGATSNWAMKLTAVSGTYTPTIETTYQSYATVPTTYTKVASKDSSTDTVTGASFKSTYAAYIAPTQHTGTYEGKVKYTLVHPTNHAAPIIPAYLDTGENVNAKMKSLAADTTVAYNTIDTLIKSIQTINSLPANFEATEANTISLTNSKYPVYIYFDNENDAGIMYIYSGDATPVLNPDSSSMFFNLRNLSTAPAISSWDTSNVTNMGGMFTSTGRSSTVFSLDLSAWDTSKVTQMSGMFQSAGRSTTATTAFSLNLSNWNTSSVTDMSYMFSYAGYSAANWSIDGLSSWDTSNVTDMTEIFNRTGYNADSFSLNLSGWNTSKITHMSNIFYSVGYSATTWSIGNLSNWDTSSATDMSNMFNDAGHSATTWSIGDLSSWDTSRVINMSGMFDNAGYSATTWSIGNLSDWDTSSVTNMSYMFYSAGNNSSTFSLDLSDWDTSSVTDMKNLFNRAGYSASTFSLNLSSWNSSSVIDMSDMFKGTGYSAVTWSVIIPQANGNGISNTTSAMYGETSSVYGEPDSGKSFTLAQ